MYIHINNKSNDELSNIPEIVERGLNKMLRRAYAYPAEAVSSTISRLQRLHHCHKYQLSC